MDRVLKKVKEFAEEAHGDQKRKYNEECFILHPERVMQYCQQFTSSIPVLSAALLHDVLEDTEVTENELYNFLLSVMNEEDAKHTTQLVIELTDVYTKQKYGHWNRKKRKNKEALRIEGTSAEAQTIKYADIIDNCREIVTHDPEFAPVFLKECKMLLNKMPKGHEILYKRSKETVENCLSQIPKKHS